MIRAKFRVRQRTEVDDELWHVILAPVRGKDPANEMFGKHTPSGTLEMRLVSDVAKELNPGREFYLTFDPT